MCLRGLRKAPSVCHRINRSPCPPCQLNYSCTKANAHICGGSSFPVCYEPAVMWLYRDQSFLYPASQYHIPYSFASDSVACPPLPLCSIFQSLPLVCLCLSCFLTLLFFFCDFIRTDSLYLFVDRFSLLSLKYPLFLPPSHGSQTISPTHLLLSHSVFLAHFLFSPWFSLPVMSVLSPSYNCPPLEDADLLFTVFYTSRLSCDLTKVQLESLGVLMLLLKWTDQCIVLWDLQGWQRSWSFLCT